MLIDLCPQCGGTFWDFREVAQAQALAANQQSAGERLSLIKQRFFKKGSVAKLNDSTLESYRDDYARNGAVALRQVISPKWIERLRDGVEENLREPGR